MVQAMDLLTTSSDPSWFGDAISKRHEKSGYLCLENLAVILCSRCFLLYFRHVRTLLLGNLLFLA